jgi:hypothetical protein
MTSDQGRSKIEPAINIGYGGLFEVSDAGFAGTRRVKIERTYHVPPGDVSGVKRIETCPLAALSLQQEPIKERVTI